MIPEYEAYKDCLSRHLEIDDWQAVEIVLACAVVHKVTCSTMLWLRVIGASGSGKTEILRSLINLKDYNETRGYTETMETITPSSIRRGMQIVRRDKKTDELVKVKLEPTLLELLDGKLVITKELAPLLTKQHDARLEMFGLLRSVHDGELVADYGSMQGRVTQKCKFDWILGTTTYVDSENQLEMQLGSRFTDLRWGTPLSRRDAIKQAIYHIRDAEKFRGELTYLAGKMVAHSEAECIERYDVNNPDNDWIIELANIVAYFRTPVPRDRFTKDIVDNPMPELGTRLGQCFARIAQGLCMLGIEDFRPHITRLAWDALPPSRALVLKAALELESMELPVTQENIESHNHNALSQSSISYIMRDLRLLESQSLPWREYLGFYYTN